MSLFAELSFYGLGNAAADRAERHCATCNQERLFPDSFQWVVQDSCRIHLLDQSFPELL
jgi:hypothetical protein